jgi:hypothetical protein
MKSNDINKQETNGSTKKPSKEFEEKKRLGRVQLMKETYEKRMKEYREKKARENQNQKDQNSQNKK